MARWRQAPEPWWPAVYAEQRYTLADVPGRYDLPLERFAVTAVEVLLRTLPSRYVGGYSMRPVARGTGIGEHTPETGWPRVFPRVVIVTPPGQAEPTTLYHFRYHPDAFDDRAGWADRRHVMRSLQGAMNQLRRQAGAGALPPVGDEYMQKFDTYREWHPSSYRLAAVAASVTNELLAAESDLLHVPEENRPYVELQGLRVGRDHDEGVTAARCPAAL